MRSSLLTILSLGLMGCVPVLMPAATAMRVPGAKDYAYTEVGAVRVWASGAAWTGAPTSLAEVMTPIAVSLENHSGKQLRLTFKDFVLLGSSGVRYSALPPFPVDAHSQTPRAVPGVVLADYHPAAPLRSPPHRHAQPPVRFWVAPPAVRFYGGVPMWPYPWLWWDAAYHSRWYSSWPMPLPSEDMLRRALPEGVLDDGGTVSGFLYFQYAAREANVILEFELHEATTGEDLGIARVPFEVQR